MEVLSPESSTGTATPVAGVEEQLPDTTDTSSMAASGHSADSHIRSPAAADADVDVDDEDPAEQAREDRGEAKEGPSAKDTLKRLLKGKEKEWTAVAEKKGPLRLLDLPVDVLREIINQVSRPRPNVLQKPGGASWTDSLFESYRIPMT